MTRMLKKTPPRFARGERVEVLEDTPWSGVVLSVKWSSVSGWWYEVNADNRPGAWSVPEGYLHAPSLEEAG